MSRWIAALFAIAGGAIVAAAATVATVVGLYGLLWIFLFGDSEWPEWVRPALDLSIPAVGLLLWGLFASCIWMSLSRRAG